MARRVFFSFHYDRDAWRVSTIRGIGKLEGQPLLSSNRWEEVRRGGDAAIKRWINEQMSGRSCVVVLIGQSTAGRKWVNYEIEKAWKDEKGLVGVYIHNLKDASGLQSSKGSNPFAPYTVGQNKKALSTVVKAYDPPYSTSTYVYDHIKSNIEDWVEEAIDIRKSFTG